MDTDASKTRDNIQVVVRIRPVNEEERRDTKYTTVTQAINDRMLVFDPRVERSISLLHSKQDVSRRRFKELKYAFDYVFGPTAKNQDVFSQSMTCIVEGVVEGYNCSVFAYGATGAGKTHTMLGNDSEPGVIYHTMIDLYKKINDYKHEKSFDVSVSYSEVYNEQVRDLLIPRGNLPIREEKRVGVIITGLSLHKPKSAEELLHILQFGNKNRTQHPTDANAESSRSHAVFQVFVSQKYKTATVNTEVKMAKMCLVDLAGSERAHATTNHGLRFREGANINRSLLALGNVINALADSRFKGHIPYRESKLTRLLKDSLGGNCRTLMIAAVSPSSKSYDDTYNTLRYADRAKHIRANLKQNVMSVDLHIANYKKYVEELEKETQDLRRAKINLEKQLELRARQPTPTPGVKDLDKKLLKLFKTRSEIRKSQMASDGVVRELKWKVLRKEKTIHRVQQLTQSLHVMGKHSRIVERMKQRIEKEEAAFESAMKRLKNQESLIQSTFLDAANKLRSAGFSIDILEPIIRLHTVEASLEDTTTCLTFVKKMARAQERQAASNEKLITSLIEIVKRQYDAINSQAPNLLLGDLKNKFEECCYLVEERGAPRVEEDSSKGKEQGDVYVSEIIDIKVPRLHVASSKFSSRKHNPINTSAVNDDNNVISGNTHSSISSNSRRQSSSINVDSRGDTFIKQMSKPVAKSIKPAIKPTNAVKPSARRRRSSQNVVEQVNDTPLVTLAHTSQVQGIMSNRISPTVEANRPSIAQSVSPSRRPTLVNEAEVSSTSQEVTAGQKDDVARPIANDMHAHMIPSTSSVDKNTKYRFKSPSPVDNKVKNVKRKVSHSSVSHPIVNQIDQQVQDSTSSSDKNTFEVQTKQPPIKCVDNSFTCEKKLSHAPLNVGLLHTTSSSNEVKAKMPGIDDVKSGHRFLVRPRQRLKKTLQNNPSTTSQLSSSSQNMRTKTRRLSIPSVFLESAQKKTSPGTHQKMKDRLDRTSQSLSLRESGSNSIQSLHKHNFSPSSKFRGMSVSDITKVKHLGYLTKKPSSMIKSAATISGDSKNTNFNIEPKNKELTSHKQHEDVNVTTRSRPSPAPRALPRTRPTSKPYRLDLADSTENRSSNEAPDTINTQINKQPG